MPCYSRILTKMLELETIKKAAMELGMNIDIRNPNYLVLTKSADRMELRRSRQTDPFAAVDGTRNYEERVLQPLIEGYALQNIRTFAKKKGYSVVKGKKPGEYALVSYK